MSTGNSSITIQLHYRTQGRRKNVLAYQLTTCFRGHRLRRMTCRRIAVLWEQLLTERQKSKEIVVCKIKREQNYQEVPMFTSKSHEGILKRFGKIWVRGEANDLKARRNISPHCKKRGHWDVDAAGDGAREESALTELRTYVKEFEQHCLYWIVSKTEERESLKVITNGAFWPKTGRSSADGFTSQWTF